MKKVEVAGGVVLQWPDACATDERIFLDVPWDVARALVGYAAECVTEDAILACTKAMCLTSQVAELPDLTLPASLDSPKLRAVLGAVAKKHSWFKDIERGEHIATLIYPCLDQIAAKPLGLGLKRLRAWVDG